MPGLSPDRIIAVARQTRQDHPAPPDGPTALDRAMARAARDDAQCASPGHGNRDGGRRQRSDSPRPSADKLAAFYADLVNSERYLPASTISNTIRDAMLARGLVTPERLRLRGVR